METEKRNATEKLERAYFEMLEATHYSRITVSDIINKAQVSRTTFYRHYDDIFDMHKEIADKFALSLIETCCKLVMKNICAEQDCPEQILAVFNSQKKYIILLSGENGSRYFFESIIRRSMEVLTSLNSAMDEEMLFRVRFIVVAIVGVYVRDILDDREHCLDYIDICKKIVSFDEFFGGGYAGKS